MVSLLTTLCHNCGMPSLFVIRLMNAHTIILLYLNEFRNGHSQTHLNGHQLRHHFGEHLILSHQSGDSSSFVCIVTVIYFFSGLVVQGFNKSHSDIIIMHILLKFVNGNMRTLCHVICIFFKIKQSFLFGWSFL